MNSRDDMIGRPLWNTPPSDVETRKEFVKIAKAHAEEFKRFDPTNYRGGLSTLITQIPIPEDATEEDIRVGIDKAVKISESLAKAAEDGKPRQAVLSAILRNGRLYGITLNPETGKSLSTSAKLDGFPPEMADVFRTPLVLGMLSKWAEEQNAVIAWGAVRALCEIEFPKNTPEL